MLAERQLPKDMINNENIGTYMTWKDIVHLYPDRWVYLTDFELDSRRNIVGGILRIVCEEPEFSLVEDIIMEKGKKGYLKRTTELPGNILWVE
ncbi:MAG: hypothetical protein K5985_08130 [Lachnospiraceae bacterium]|nr:hypothetical protein [Lachnospiraceae bacterium]